MAARVRVYVVRPRARKRVWPQAARPHARAIHAWIGCCLPCPQADLNKYEYSAPSEFGQGSSQQWGEADIDGRDFSNQDLRRSNFTSASCKRTNFSNSNMQGAYFMKAVSGMAGACRAPLKGPKLRPRTWLG